MKEPRINTTYRAARRNLCRKTSKENGVLFHSAWVSYFSETLPYRTVEHPPVRPNQSKKWPVKTKQTDGLIRINTGG